MQKKKDFKSAENLYLKAIKLNPEFFQAHYNLGNINKNSGNLNEAVNYFQKSIEIDTQNPEELLKKILVEEHKYYPKIIKQILNV